MSGPPPRRREHFLDQQLTVGRLLAHGPAKYLFRPQESQSYYLKLKTSKGARVLWGTDLERALLTGETQPKIGEMIGARRVGREPVTVGGEQWAYRNRWRVERLQFFTERAKLARRLRDEQIDTGREIKAHPELKSAFLTLRGAEEIAARKIRDPEDRQRFMALVKEAMAGSVARGEPLPAIRMQQRVARKKGALLPTKDERSR